MHNIKKTIGALIFTFWATSSFATLPPEYINHLALSTPIPYSEITVVDGESVMIGGIRRWIYRLDAPSIDNPSCPQEKEVAEKAKSFLDNLLKNSDIIYIQNMPNSNYIVPVVGIYVKDGPVGPIMDSENLAVYEIPSHAWLLNSLHSLFGVNYESNRWCD